MSFWLEFNEAPAIYVISVVNLNRALREAYVGLEIFSSEDLDRSHKVGYTSTKIVGSDYDELFGSTAVFNEGMYKQLYTHVCALPKFAGNTREKP